MDNELGLIDHIIAGSLTSLERRENYQVARMSALYMDAFSKVEPELIAVIDTIATARDNGETVNPAWLRRQQRYINLMLDIDRRYRELNGDAAGILQEGLASADIEAMLSATMMHGAVEPEFAERDQSIAAELSAGRVNQNAMERYSAITVPGSPLRKVFGRWGEPTERLIENEIVRGMALGRNPHEVARRISNGNKAITYAKARQITRTEMMRAYRGSQTRQFKSLGTAMVVWRAQLGPRTCMACVAMHGTKYPVDQVPDKNHPQCRCVWIPLPRRAFASAQALLDQTGDDYLRTLPDDELAKYIKNPELRSAFKRGDVSASDFVITRSNDDWGQTVTARGERDVMERAGMDAPPRRQRGGGDDQGGDTGGGDRGRLDRTDGATEVMTRNGVIMEVDADGVMRPKFQLPYDDHTQGYRDQARKTRRLDQYDFTDDDSDYIRQAKQAILDGGIDPDPDQLRAIGVPITAEINTRHQQLREENARLPWSQQKNDNELYRQSYVETMAQIRPMHTDDQVPWDIKHTNRRNDWLEPMMHTSATYYPKAWVDNAGEYVSSGGGYLSLGKVKRGYFLTRSGNTRDTEIRISGTGASAQRTTTHELGHLIDDANESVNLAGLSWRDSRTAGEPLITMNKAMNTTGYKRSEKTRPDKFWHPYVGKEYARGSSEVTSMAMEYLMHDHEKLNRADPDAVQFILGVLAGL